MSAQRAIGKWHVLLGFRGRVSIVKICAAKVFAEAEAKRARAIYPDPRAEFWVSNAGPPSRGAARWALVEPQLRRDGDAITIFGASTKEVADQRVLIAVRAAIRSEIASRRVEPGFTFLPYTVQELMGHISAQFRPGMGWDSFGSEWVIDHIKPRALFDMREPDQLTECWALDNMRPLWAAENSAKSASDKAVVQAARG